MVKVDLDKWENEQVPRHRSRTDRLAAHKDPRSCPVCTEPLQKKSRGDRYESRCRACRAVLATDLVCDHCHTRRVWRAPAGSVCHGCGQTHSPASTTTHRSEFVRQLKEGVPEILPLLDGYRDSLTTEMLAFLLFTQQAIDDGHPDLIGRCFQLADRFLERGSQAVRNAIAVTLLEELDFSGATGAAAYRLLPPRLRNEWRAVHEYLHAQVGATFPRVGGAPSNASFERRRRQPPGR